MQESIFTDNYQFSFIMFLQNTHTHTDIYIYVYIHIHTHTPLLAVVWRSGRRWHVGGKNRRALLVQVSVYVLQMDPGFLSYSHQRIVIREGCPAMGSTKRKVKTPTVVFSTSSTGRSVGQNRY